MNIMFSQIRVVFYVCFLFQVTSCSSSTSEHNPKELVEGIWGWDEKGFGCSTGGAEFRVSPDGLNMTVNYAVPVKTFDDELISASHYDVVAFGDDSIDLRLHGERVFFEDAPVTWRLRLNGSDEFYWEAIEPLDSATVEERKYWIWGPLVKCD